MNATILPVGLRRREEKNGPMIEITEQSAKRREQLIIGAIVLALATLATVWCHQLCSRII
jgi:hypothetical protein